MSDDRALVPITPAPVDPGPFVIAPIRGWVTAWRDIKLGKVERERASRWAIWGWYPRHPEGNVPAVVDGSLLVPVDQRWLDEHAPNGADIYLDDQLPGCDCACEEDPRYGYIDPAWCSKCGGVRLDELRLRAVAA